MPWWRLLSRQISRNGCWLKTSGIFRPGKTAVLRQHLNNRCFKIHILAGEVLQSLSLEVSKTRLDKALSNPVRPHGWPSFGEEVALEPTGGPFQPEGLWSCSRTAALPRGLNLVKPCCASTSPGAKSYTSASTIRFWGVLRTTVNFQEFCELLPHIIAGGTMEKVTLDEAPRRPPWGLRSGFGNAAGEGTVFPPQIRFLFCTRVKPGHFKGNIERKTFFSRVKNN